MRTWFVPSVPNTLAHLANSVGFSLLDQWTGSTAVYSSCVFIVCGSKRLSYVGNWDSIGHEM